MIRTLPNPQFGLSHDALGRLVLIDAEGVRHVDVEPIRAFPLSDPAKWLSIRDADGHELVFVEDLNDLTPAVREIALAELARREFMPVITRINHLSGDGVAFLWDVTTDRGPTKFKINTEDDVRRIGSGQHLVIDSNGIRYLIRGAASLDHHSRRLLERVT